MTTREPPVTGEVWRHTKSGGHYEIIGASYNVVTDKVDVIYKPLYSTDFQRFNRPLYDHPKAWLFPNTDGTDRFVRVGKSGRRAHKIEWYDPPETTT